MRTGTILIIRRVIGQARTLECRCPSHKPKDSPSTEYRCIRARHGPITVEMTMARRRTGTSPLARLLPLSRASLLTTPTKEDCFPVPIPVRTQTWDPVTLVCHTRIAQILGGLPVRREYRLSTRESSNLRCEKQCSIPSIVAHTANIRTVGTTCTTPSRMVSYQMVQARAGRPRVLD